MTEYKIRENKARRTADRLKLILQKSRGKMWAVDNQQGYRLMDADTNFIYAGEAYEMTLDEVEACLTRRERELRSR